MQKLLMKRPQGATRGLDNLVHLCRSVILLQLRSVKEN